MNVFYIEIDDFKNKHNKDFLIPYANIELKREKRFFEYTIGRYLIKYVGENYYNIKDSTIIVDEKGKPFFKNSNLFFSLSHSKNIVIACFDNFNCGIDVEYKKDRNLKELSKYFNEEFKTLDNFYEFWTLKEASFKVNNQFKEKRFLKLNNDYYLTIVSNNENLDNIELFKI